ncbi:hypothetical protein [Nocardioides sp. Iso805N]|uniref:hypothetical protein n=1 Tax=Nocardioides sp. Iso805N TaxID=1283287 RepID=UPI000361AFB8|nr:hypothetical protein [Nocardioides sp. Iso805N]
MIALPVLGVVALVVTLLLNSTVRAAEESAGADGPGSTEWILRHCVTLRQVAITTARPPGKLMQILRDMRVGHGRSESLRGTTGRCNVDQVRHATKARHLSVTSTPVMLTSMNSRPRR